MKSRTGRTVPSHCLAQAAWEKGQSLVPSPCPASGVGGGGGRHPVPLGSPGHSLLLRDMKIGKQQPIPHDPDPAPWQKGVWERRKAVGEDRSWAVELDSPGGGGVSQASGSRL